MIVLTPAKSGVIMVKKTCSFSTKKILIILLLKRKMPISRPKQA